MARVPGGISHDYAWIVMPYDGQVLAYTVDQANYQSNQGLNQQANPLVYLKVMPFVIHPTGVAGANNYTASGPLTVPGDQNTTQAVGSLNEYAGWSVVEDLFFVKGDLLAVGVQRDGGDSTLGGLGLKIHTSVYVRFDI